MSNGPLVVSTQMPVRKVFIAFSNDGENRSFRSTALCCIWVKSYLVILAGDPAILSRILVQSGNTLTSQGDHFPRRQFRYGDIVRLTGK